MKTDKRDVKGQAVSKRRGGDGQSTRHAEGVVGDKAQRYTGANE